jgi:hypothetical protein
MNGWHCHLSIFNSPGKFRITDCRGRCFVISGTPPGLNNQAVLESALVCPDSNTMLAGEATCNDVTECLEALLSGQRDNGKRNFTCLKKLSTAPIPDSLIPRCDDPPIRRGHVRCRNNPPICGSIAATSRRSPDPLSAQTSSG